MSHRPRPLDQFLKRLPDGIRVETVNQRARLDDATLEWLASRRVQLDPWQKEVLRRHPAFRPLRQNPDLFRLTYQSRVSPRLRLRQRLRRLLSSLCPCQTQH